MKTRQTIGESPRLWSLISASMLISWLLPVSFVGQQAGQDRAKVDGIEVSIRDTPNSPAALEVVNETAGEHFSIVAKPETQFLSDLHAVQRDRVAALGSRADFGPRSSALVFDLQRRSVIDEFIGRNFSFSPSGHFLAFTHWAPRYDSSTGSWYLVYDLTASSNDNRRFPGITGIPIYALDTLETKRPDWEQHQISDRFLWLGGVDVLAFGDFYRGRVSVVVVDLREGLDKRSTFTQPIEASILSQSACANEAYTRGFNVSDAKASSKGPLILTVTLHSPLHNCGEFDIPIPGFRL